MGSRQGVYLSSIGILVGDLVPGRMHEGDALSHTSFVASRRPQDESSTELRRQLLQQSTYDDDDEAENLPWFFQLMPLAALTLITTAWFRDRRRLMRTGRHKKTDER